MAPGFFRSGVIFISAAFLDGLYHYIARSVLQTREFDHGNVISKAFKFKASKAVGQIFRQPVLQNTVLEHRLMEIVVYLAEELVLTAWYAEYHLGVPPDGVYEGIICGGITGVQRYYHIGGVVSIIGNIVIMEIFCDSAAELYHVFFEVQPYDLNV